MRVKLLLSLDTILQKLGGLLPSVPSISRPWAEVIYGKAGGRFTYAKYLFEEGKREFKKYFQGKVEVEGKMIIDIGCGDGGKTCFYASVHPKACIGMDIDPVRVSSARSFGLRMGHKNLVFLLGSSRHLPFKSGSFDVEVMNDVAEHLATPLESLKEAKRISRKRGLLLITFTSYRSAGGAHVFDRIHVPWVQSIFSDKVIIQALQHICRSNRFIGYQFPLLVKGSPKSLSDLADINKMTLNQFSRLAVDAGFSFRLLTFRPIIERKVAYLLLKILPSILAEYVTRKVVCILQKQDQGS